MGKTVNKTQKIQNLQKRHTKTKEIHKDTKNSTVISEVWEKSRAPLTITVPTTRVWADQYHLDHEAGPMFTPLKGPAHKDHHTVPREDKRRDRLFLSQKHHH